MALAAGLFGFVPFLPRLLRAAATGRRDRARMLERIRAGLDAGVDAPPEVAARPLRVFLVAGEPSGDRYAADLAVALRRLHEDTRIEGVGGPLMQAAGVHVVADLVSEPVMGVWPVARRLPQFFGLYRALLVRFAEDPPDVVVGIDYPGLNLRLARAAKARGVPFVEYIAPQVWAWAPWRVNALARDVRRLLTIIPFEKPLFATAGADVAYVGHPLIENLAAQAGDAALRERLRADVPDGGALVALLPGSRRSELRANLPLLLAAARTVAEKRPDARFVVSLAAERLRVTFDAVLREGDAPPGLEVAPPGAADDAMRAADAAITVSGTVTLHLVAHGTPAAVVYHVSGAWRLLAPLLLVSPFIALPNLLAAEEILPEFLAGPADVPRIAGAVLELLPGGARREAALASLAIVRERLASVGVPERAARWIAATAD